MSRSDEIINARRLILGEKSKLMAISPAKHQWARDIWRLMLNNTWTAQEIELGVDVQCYKTGLTRAERRMYDKALAFLSNLDGIQLHNLSDNIARNITSPEVRMCIERQAFEEALHVDAYATMIEAIALDPIEIYMTFETDAVLAKKNDFIMAMSAKLGEEFTPRNFALAIVANVCLEGIYFYSGFLAFYVLAKNGKMLGSSDMIKLIQRDEIIHLQLFLHMWETMKEENPEVFTPDFYEAARAIVREAVNLETLWGTYIINEGVLGLTTPIVEGYIKFLGNQRAASLGLGQLYANVKNPVEWVDEFSKPNGQEQNFFENKVTSYSKGALGW